MSADYAWTPYRYQPKRVDGKCKRGHVVSGDNASTRRGNSADTGCRACASGLAYARRHNLFVDDPRVVDHMNAYYESRRDD